MDDFRERIRARSEAFDRKSATAKQEGFRMFLADPLVKALLDHVQSDGKDIFARLLEAAFGAGFGCGQSVSLSFMLIETTKAPDHRQEEGKP